MYHWMRENGLKAQRGHAEEIMATETVLKVSIFAKNNNFTFWRFLSDRHEISKIRKNCLEVYYLATCMPIFRLISIFKNK